jgi:hypothetical protein
MFLFTYLDFYKILIVLHFKPIAEICKNLIVRGVTVQRGTFKVLAFSVFFY